MKLYIERTDEENSVKKILNDKKICILSGQAGIGKTTLAMKILRQEPHSLYINMGTASINSLDKEATLQYEDAICVIDDIDNVNEIIENPAIRNIRDKNQTRLLLICRSKCADKSMPSVVLKPFSREDMLSVVSRYEDISEEDAKIIMECSQGNPLLLFSFIDLRQEQGLSADEIMSTLSVVRARNSLSEYAINTRSKKQTPEKSRELLFQISFWGPIERNKLAQWNPSENIDDSIEILVTNGYITDGGDKLYATLKTMKFSERDQNGYIHHLVQVFSHDADNNLKNEKDIIILIEQLKKHDDTVAYVAWFYEEQYKSEERKERAQQQALLVRVLESQLGLQQGMQHIESTLGSIQSDIRLEIDKMLQAAEGDKDTIDKLNQLLEISQNPQKNFWGVANGILGALGSAASIASIMGVSNLPALIQQLLTTSPI